MTAAAPRSLLVAPAEEVEPILRDARAGVARLTLQLRNLAHEVERAEGRDGSTEREAARALLRSNLDDVVLRRRRELEQLLDDVRDECRLVIEAANVEAAALRAELERTRQSEAEPDPSTPPRLRVVDLRDTAPSIEVPVLLDATVPKVEVIEPEPEPVLEPEAPAPGPVAEPVEQPHPSASSTELTSERLAPLVEAAVAAALAGIAATTGLLAGQPRLPAMPPTQPLDRRPIWRRFLYADVLLPLIAGAAVLLIVFAWAG